MRGYLALVLHAHLPFVRHPEHEVSLEENWLFEAITETYVPLARLLENWQRDGLDARLTLTLSPTLCSMLNDKLLRDRYCRHLEQRIELAERESHRTLFESSFQELARYYRDSFVAVRDYYDGKQRDLVGVFGRLQDAGRVEILTTAATHAVLPLLAEHPASIQAQLCVARDNYRSCFGREAQGIWLPECGYVAALDERLRSAGFRWFITDTHGLLGARPRPRFGVFAPILTPNGLAVFGRDRESAEQVWSRHGGYPGDPRYREFHRDIGFDLDLDYVQPFLAAAGRRGFTGIKYYRITGASGEKAVYERESALAAAAEHASHFLEARTRQLERAGEVLGRPALAVCPYDAELFGHWWHEGPEFLDALVRRAAANSPSLRFTTLGEYLRLHPTHQTAVPAASSWGAGGQWQVWVNEKTRWIYPELEAAHERMTELSRRFDRPAPIEARALRQAGRELLLAQASDWPFILNAGTSPEYARQRVTEHLSRFNTLYKQLNSGACDETWLARTEAVDNLLPELNYRYWR